MMLKLEPDATSAAAGSSSKKRAATSKAPQSGPFKRTRLSLSRAVTSKPENDVKMEELERKEVIHITQCLVSMGEYQEALKPIFEEGALELVLFMLSYFRFDKFVLHEILRMVLTFPLLLPFARCYRLHNV